MLLGDIGETASLASRNELHRAELSIFRPIKCMLASSEPTAEAIWERFVVAAAVSGGDTARQAAQRAAATVFIEDKFDGIRAQLHRGADRVEIFSRDLRRLTDQFAELARSRARVSCRSYPRRRDHRVRARKEADVF